MKVRMEQQRRYLQQQSDEEYDNMMDGIRNRVMSRPLLVEQGPFYDRGTNTYEEEEEMEEIMVASDGDIPEDVDGELEDQAEMQ